MTPLILAACLLFGLPAGECRAEAQMQDLTAWAQGVHTQQTAPPPAWQLYAGHIVAGESPAGCQACDQIIACTLLNDVKHGYSPRRLYPNRWHGWRDYVTPVQQQAITNAVTTDICDSLPVCMFLGNANDYRHNWTHLGPGVIWGNQNGLVVCIEAP